MKWKKFTLTTTTEAVDLISSMLDDLGVEGIEIEDLRAKKGSVWVLHFTAAEKLLGADYLASPLPVR